MTAPEYDLAVIGAGLSAAITAAGDGAKVPFGAQGAIGGTAPA